MMKIRWFCMMLAATAGSVTASAAVTNASPIAVVISCPQTSVVGSAKVELSIRITNISNQETDVFVAPVGHAEDANIIHIYDALGRPVRRVDYDAIMINGRTHKIRKRLNIERAGYVLRPQETIENYADISDIFDLSQPGVYSIYVESERRAPDDSGPVLNQVLQRSNQIQLEVKEKPH
jgi:hypothetical protein